MKRIVSAWVVYENTILFVLHKKHSLWLPPGGHVEHGETIYDAVHRELQEETGLAIELVDYSPRSFKTDRDALPLPFNIMLSKKIHFEFLATSSTKHVVLQEEKLDEYMWLTKEEVQAHPDIIEPVKQKALFALQYTHSC